MMFWQKIRNSVLDKISRNSVIAENQCLYMYEQKETLVM